MASLLMHVMLKDNCFLGVQPYDNYTFYRFRLTDERMDDAIHLKAFLWNLVLNCG